MSNLQRTAIAERLRGLLGGQDQGDLARTAARLGVEELSLRMSIDELSPHPTVEVLAAAVRVYGVDPSWLLTGEYDANTHRAAIQSDTSAYRVLNAFAQHHAPRIATPTAAPFHVNEPN